MHYAHKLFLGLDELLEIHSYIYRYVDICIVCSRIEIFKIVSISNWKYRHEVIS